MARDSYWIIVNSMMPAPEDHAPLSVLNHRDRCPRTMIICSCEWMPAEPPDRASTRHDAHDAHRKALGLPPAAPGSEVFGQGPWAGMTWDAWYAEHQGEDLDPYTGRTRSSRYTWAEAEVGQARR